MTYSGYFVLSVFCWLLLQTCYGDSCAKQMLSMKTQQKKTNNQLEELGKKMDIVLSIVQELQKQSALSTPKCDREFCNGNGECVSSGMNAYGCKCDEMYSGEHCEVFGPCHAAYEGFLHHGVPDYEPRCDAEGLFKPVQINDVVAFCVDKNGANLGYEVDAMEANPENDCACAIAGEMGCGVDGSYYRDGGYDDGAYFEF